MGNLFELRPAEQAESAETYAAARIPKRFQELGYPLHGLLAEPLEGRREYKAGPSKPGGYLQAATEIGGMIRHDRNRSKDIERVFNLIKGKFAEKEEALLAADPSKGRIPASELLEPEEFQALLEQFKTLPGTFGKKLGVMLHDLLSPYTKPDLPTFPATQRRVVIGSCTKAEQYYFHATQETPKDGSVLLDQDGTILAWQKLAQGEETFITFKTIVVNGVRVPAGSLISCQPKDPAPSEEEKRVYFKKKLLSIEDVESVRFLRLSSLALPPEERRPVLAELMDLYRNGDFPGADTATLEQLKQHVEEYLTTLQVKENA